MNFLRPKLVGIAILFIVPLLSYAQKKIEIGGELGINVAQLEYHGTTSGSTSKIAAFFTSDFLISDNFSLLGKIGYSSKGGNNLVYNNNSFSGNFNYLSFYASPRLYLSTINSVRPYFHLGPSMSFLLSAKQNDFDLKDETENMDFAL
ncbi:MAG: hypothetical protein Tsb004_29970 [Allomuricauda sp.]